MQEGGIKGDRLYFKVGLEAFQDDLKIDLERNITGKSYKGRGQ